MLAWPKEIFYRPVKIRTRVLERLRVGRSARARVSYALGDVKHGRRDVRRGGITLILAAAAGLMALSACNQGPHVCKTPAERGNDMTDEPPTVSAEPVTTGS